MFEQLIQKRAAKFRRSFCVSIRRVLPSKTSGTIVPNVLRHHALGIAIENDLLNFAARFASAYVGPETGC